MYVESGDSCFDPTLEEAVAVAEDVVFPDSFHLDGTEEGEEEARVSAAAATAAIEMEFQQRLNLEMEKCYNNDDDGDSNNPQFMPKMGSQQQDGMIFNINNQGMSNWEEMVFSEMQMSSGSNNNHHHLLYQPQPPSDLLNNMFPFPRPSSSSSSQLLPNPPSFSSSNFLNSLGLFGDHLPSDSGASPSSHVLCDPSLLPLNLPPQPPLLRDLFHSLPPQSGGYGGFGSLFGEVVDERGDQNQVNGGFYPGMDGRDFENGGVFEFSGDLNGLGKNRDGKGTKHFATERQRRVHLNDKYEALKRLVPNPSKNDRASVVHDAIGYINELKRTVGELKILVEKKRCSRERMKRQKIDGDGSGGCGGGGAGEDVKDLQSYNGTALRSSWLQRKSKNTEVDVRIIDDEVTVKLVQQKRINCLLFVSKALDDLQLDLHHVAGGLIGDYYSFLFNSKICEGSTVYASAIANKLIEVVDKHYTTTAPTNSY
ncbi:unnamed protein product [Cuscuta epithymum]|uniref:BHLH domain-containing protein n=1 Tax=Cuscuta epithymum TaxID=186058 RepID=A0AAV0CV20_9ASTE|nr:unnamed protein product [Cuscuta epithymum]